MISLRSLPSPFPRAKARARLLTLSTALALVCGPALAQDTGKAAFDAYVEGLKSLGLEVENGAVDYDAGSDTLTITDSKLVFGGSITNIPSKKDDTDGEAQEPESLAYSISLSSGTVTISGLTHDENTFSAASWNYSDDTELAITGSLSGAGRLKAEGRISGMAATDYRFTMPEIPAEDPKHQASRWLPFFKAAMLTSYDEVKFDSSAMAIEAYVEKDDKETLAVSGTIQIDGYVIADATNGLIGSYSVDRMTQNLQTLDPSSGRMVSQMTSQGKTIYENVNAAALVNLFDPDVPVTGDEVTMIGTGSTVDYESSQEIEPGLLLKMNIDRASIDEVTLVKRDNNFLAVVDELLETQEPSPEALITSVFQFYRSFGMTDARISGISITAPTPEPGKEFGMSIREMAMTNIDSSGIGEMMIVGLDAPNLPNGASVKLDWASIGDIEFAEYTPMRAMISTLMADPDYGDSHPLDVARAFMPRSFGYEVEGLDVNDPKRGRTQIGKAELSLSTTVPPLPTSFFLKNNGIRIPVSALEDDETIELLQALGLETLAWSDETRLYWDEATLELRLERMMLDVEGLGKAEVSARFANVPKALFEDPEGQAQMALISAQFVDASLVFNDAGVISKGLKHAAKTQGIPEDAFREALVTQATEATKAIRNEAFTKMVSDAASKFLNNPGELKVSLSPANPVPLAQILGSMAAPQTIPDLLAVKIEAN